ncbi:unnamed protein product [Mytilus edulis]|uniref:Uncharacterized protein n=1 Tax=Mytilus edulis TaxID=6550 RepID=A0A8S3PTZ0_MYTED|nr:unnamed protein product [Mytilus edulis]
MDNIARRNIAPADQQMTGNTSQTSASSDNAPNTTSSDTNANLNTDTILTSQRLLSVRIINQSVVISQSIALARVLVTASQDMVYARLFNPTSTDIILYKGTHIAVFVPVLNIGNSVEVEDENEDVCEIVEHRNSSNRLFPQYMEKMYQRGIQNLSIKEADEFKKVLLQNCCVFADPEGETGHTLLGMHELEIKLEKEIPIKEPRRRVPLFKRKILEEEIEKLEMKELLKNRAVLGQHQLF